MSSVKKLAIRGTVWTIAGYGAGQSLRFGANLILTRLLFPDLFGLMALVNVFIMALHQFSDLGIGPSIIQNKRGDEPAFLNTAWTLQVIRGFGLWFACLLLTWPIATLYREPRFLWLIPIFSLVSVADGFTATAIFTLNRHMVIGKITRFEFWFQLVSYAVLLTWAYLSRSIWALVGGALVSSLIHLVWSHFLVSGPRNRFAWEPDALKEIFSLGKWIFLSTVVSFLAGQADKLILARLISFQMLGVYNIAFTLADIPRQVIIKIGGSIIFPLIAKQADISRESLRAKILQKRWLILIVSAIVLTFPISFGDLLISVLYDKRYFQATWMMPILALGLWHTLLYSTASPSLLAIGKPLYSTWGNLLTFLTISIGLPTGFFLGKMLGAVIVLALSDLPLYGAVMYGLWRERLGCISQDLKATALFLGLLTLVLMIRFNLGFGLPIKGIL